MHLMNTSVSVSQKNHMEVLAAVTRGQKPWREAAREDQEDAEDGLIWLISFLLTIGTKLSA
jgi:hypothetical protein